MGTDDNHNRRRHTGPFSLLLSGRGRPSTTHLLRLLLLVALVSLLGISTTSIRLSGSAGGSQSQDQGAEEMERIGYESFSFLEAHGGRLDTTAMKEADLARHSAVALSKEGQKAPLTRSLHSQATCEDLHRSSGPVMWRLRDQALEGERTRGGIAYVGEKPFQPQWGIQQVYVVHYSPEKARRERMQEQLEKLGFNGGVYVTGMDVNDMTDVQLCALYRPMMERGAAGRDPSARHKVPYWVSSTAKHHLALWDQARNGYNTSLVLEDDACVRLPSDESDDVCADSVTLEELKQLLPQKLALLPPDFDMLFIGGCRRDLYNDKFKIVKDTLARATASRCVSAIVVSLSGARKLLDALPFARPMDIHINGVIGNMKKQKQKQQMMMQVYWLVPQLLGQTDQGGSHATKR